MTTRKCNAAEYLKACYRHDVIRVKMYSNTRLGVCVEFWSTDYGAWHKQSSLTAYLHGIDDLPSLESLVRFF